MIGLDINGRQGSGMHCSYRIPLVEGQGAGRLMAGRKL